MGLPEASTVQPVFCTIPDALTILGIRRTKLYELARDGEIERVKIGKRTLFPVESIHAYTNRIIEQARATRGAPQEWEQEQFAASQPEADIDAYLAKIAAAAPPLTDEQRTRLTDLLRQK